MEKCQLKFVAQSNHPDLRLTVELDNNIFFDGTLSEQKEIVCPFNDDNTVHQLSIAMSGKRVDHTEIDQQGNILRDHWIDISNVELDGIPIDPVFLKNSQYWHSFNRAEPHQADVFWGVMGCNGTVRFEFQGPVYMWLLENM